MELRLDGGDGEAVARAVAALDLDHAFAVGSTITVPLHDRDWRDVANVVTAAGVRVMGTTTRTPTLDDVYLRLTGDRLAA